MTTIDAHQHFIDVGAMEYYWLPPESPIHRDWTPADLRPELDRAGVDATVAVQADNHIADTDYLLRLAAEHDWIAAVVGWVPLDDPEAAAGEIERHRRDHPRFRGVRYLIHLEPDPDWVLQDAVIESLELLAAHGLVFEVSVTAGVSLRHVPALAERVPKLQLVVPHMAIPPAHRGGWEPWAGDFARAAEYPQVSVKLSALERRMERDRWTSDDFQPYVDHALETFGPGRMMWASNWPVSELGGSYERVFRGHAATLDGLDDEERAQILGGTAIRVYGLDLAD